MFIFVLLSYVLSYFVGCDFGSGFIGDAWVFVFL